MSDYWWDHVTYNPLIMSGTPLVNGVPVWQVLKTFARTLSAEEVRRAHPHLTPEDLRAALLCAADSCQSTPR
jgi:uncharacterized protein (DUF433 family)